MKRIRKKSFTSEMPWDVPRLRSFGYTLLKVGSYRAFFAGQYIGAVYINLRLFRKMNK